MRGRPSELICDKATNFPGAERVLHPRDDVRGVQVGCGDGPRDARREPQPRRGPHRHERALVALARRLPGHRRDPAQADRQDQVSSSTPFQYELLHSVNFHTTCVASVRRYHSHLSRGGERELSSLTRLDLRFTDLTTFGINIIFDQIKNKPGKVCSISNGSHSISMYQHFNDIAAILTLFHCYKNPHYFDNILKALYLYPQ